MTIPPSKNKNTIPNQKSNWWFLILMLLCILAFFIGGLRKEHDQRVRLQSNGIETTCRVIEKGYSKGPDILVAYEVDAKQYTQRTGSPCRIDTGEQFVLFYAIDDPADSKIIFSKPVIPKDFQKTEGKITRMDDTFFTRVQYEFSVHGIIYRKEQVIEEGMPISIGEKIIVCYKNSNPDQSYMQW